MNKAVPEFLYHGTITGDIEEFEPRKRYAPGNGNIPPRIYATSRADFAAMHAFPWSSDEGIDIVEREGKLYLQIPLDFKNRVNQSVYIYTLKGGSFSLTEEEKTGNTYHTEVAMKPEAVEQFASVIEAIEHYGGGIEFI